MPRAAAWLSEGLSLQGPEGGILQTPRIESSKNEPPVPGLLLVPRESHVLGDCDGPREDGGHLQGAGTATLGQRWTCPSQEDKDLVGLLHSLAMTLRSFCKTHISRLCPNQAGETPACCLPGICDGDKDAWAGSLWVPPLPVPKNRRPRHTVPRWWMEGMWEGPWPISSSRLTSVFRRKMGAGAESY